MVVVTHEMGFAGEVAHRVVFMADGQIVEQAPPEQFFTDPRSDRARDLPVQDPVSAPPRSGRIPLMRPSRTGGPRRFETVATQNVVSGC